MLDPEYIRHITDGAEQIASALHEAIIADIVGRIMLRLERGDDYKLTAIDRWQLDVLRDAGYLREDLEREIAGKTGLMLDEMAAAFEDAAARSDGWDRAVYEAAGLEPASLERSPWLQRLVQRGYEKTAGEWKNFTGTLADAAQRKFITECDKAYHLVSSGAMSFSRAAVEAVETVARDGVRVTYPSGHTDTVETATFRAVRTGVVQACGDVTIARMRELEWDVVLVSAHLGARTGDGGENWTNHAWFQGKFYSRGNIDAASLQRERAGAAVSKKEAPPAARGNSVAEYIGRSVGAKAKNYKVYNPATGEDMPLTEGTRITQPKNHIMAGKGREREIEQLQFLLDKYGGDPLEWTKEKGFGFVDDKYGESHCVELHWYQEPTVGKVRMKIKVQPDGRIYLEEG